MNSSSIRVLLVDNQVDAREWLAEWLRRQADCFVDTAENSEQCLKKVREASGNYDVIVMDLLLGKGRDGIDTMKEVAKLYPTIETIIITGFGELKDNARAIKAGAYRYLLKPFEREDLVAYIYHAVEHRKLVESFSALRIGLDLTTNLDAIVENLRGMFNLTTCAIALLDEDRTRLEVVAERGVGKKLVRSLADLPADFNRLLEGEEILEITDLNKREDWKRVLVRNDLASLTFLRLNDRNGEPLGVITMGRTARSDRSAHQNTLLRGLAVQASITIENARLIDETQKGTKLLETLQSAALDIADPVKVTDVLTRTLQAATNLLQASGGAIYLFPSSPENQELEVRAAYGLPEISEGTKVPASQGVVGQVLKTRAPFTKVRYYEWAERQKVFDHLHLKSVIGVPIEANEKLLGVLCLHHIEQEEFTAAQEKILSSFGKHAGSALHKAEMLDELNTADELIDALVSNPDEVQLKEKLLELLEVHLHYDYSSLLLKNDAANQLELQSTRFPPEDDGLLPVKLTRDKGVTALAALENRTVIVPDVRQEPLYIPALADARSEIAVPLCSDGKVIGVINVESRKPDAFSDRDDRILTRVAKAVTAHVGQFQRINDAKTQLKESVLLRQFTDEIIRAENLTKKVEIVSNKLLEISGADFGLVMLLTRDGHNLRVRAANARNELQWDPGIERLCSILENSNVADAVRLSSHRIFSNSDPSGKRLLAQIREHLALDQPLKSVLLVRFRQGGSLLGLCMLGQLETGRDAEVFTGETIGSAVVLADTAHPLIEQARSLELEAAREQVLTKLNEVGRAVTATFEQERIFGLINEFCTTIVNAEVSTVFLVKQPGFLSLASSKGSPEGSAEFGLKLDMRTEADVGLTGFVARSGQVFNRHGKDLVDHPAIKNKGPHSHLPSRYCASMLAVPLIRQVGDKAETIGLIKLENKKDQNDKIDRLQGFSQEDELVLLTLASFAVTAIQNAEHFAFNQALQKVSQAVHSSIDDYRKVLDRVLVELRPLIPFDTASIQIIRGNKLKVMACEWNDEIEKHKVLKLEFPLTPKFPNHEVITTRTPRLIDDVRASEYEHFWKEKIYCSSHIRSWMGIPLLFDDQAIGMLSIESNEPFFYTQLHLERAAAFANQVAPAVKNAELYKSANSLMSSIEDLNKELDCATVLQKIADDAINQDAFIAADKALIYEYDADREHFIGHAVYAGPPLMEPHLSNPPFSPDSIIHRCTPLKEPHLAPDISSSEVLVGGRFAEREGIASAAIFPLLVEARLVGLMFINYVTHHEFTTPEVDVMKLFARHAALAIHTAREYQRVLKKMEVSTVSARAGRVLSIWGHDLHHVALGIQLEVDVLRSKIDEADRASLEMIYQYASKIPNVIPALPHRHNVERVNLADVLEKVHRECIDGLTGKNVALKAEVEDLPAVSLNNIWLIWIFTQLIKNALRFTPAGKTITVQGKVNHRRLSVDVIDVGPGMPDDLRDQLYVGGVSDPDSDGRGIGLLLIKTILNDYDADISRPSIDDRGNVFTLDLPLAPPEKGEQ